MPPCTTSRHTGGSTRFSAHRQPTRNFVSTLDRLQSNPSIFARRWLPNELITTVGQPAALPPSTHSCAQPPSKPERVRAPTAPSVRSAEGRRRPALGAGADALVRTGPPRAPQDMPPTLKLAAVCRWSVLTRKCGRAWGPPCQGARLRSRFAYRGVLTLDMLLGASWACARVRLDHCMRRRQSRTSDLPSTYSTTQLFRLPACLLSFSRNTAPSLFPPYVSTPSTPRPHQASRRTVFPPTKKNKKTRQNRRFSAPRART